jgi:GAF domain-containing protein
MRPLINTAATDKLGKAEPDLSTAAIAEKSGKGKPESADIAFARLATELVQNEARPPEQQEDDGERSQLLTEITLRIRQSLYLEDVLKTTVKEVRRALKTDRVIIYGFDPNNWVGTVVAESVAPGWPKTLRVKIDEPCLKNGYVEMYKNGKITSINNIYQEPRVTDCYRKSLEQFAVKANLVAPILKNNELLGLMIAHQCSEPRTWQKPEVDLFAQLATQVGLAIDQASFLEQQEDDAERSQLLTEITLRLRESLYLEDVLKTTVKEVRRALKTDRVLIYGLDPTNWDGFVVAESVAPGWPQTLRVRIDDPCLRNGFVEMYKNGQVTSINNIYQDPRVTDCYRKALEQFAVKANLVAPILRNNQLLGLMIAHQCSEPRTWQKPEMDFFGQLATYVGYAVDKASLLEQMEQEQEL